MTASVAGSSTLDKCFSPEGQSSDETENNPIITSTAGAEDRNIEDQPARKISVQTTYENVENKTKRSELAISTDKPTTSNGQKLTTVMTSPGGDGKKYDSASSTENSTDRNESSQKNASVAGNSSTKSTSSDFKPTATNKPPTKPMPQQTKFGKDVVAAATSSGKSTPSTSRTKFGRNASATSQMKKGKHSAAVSKKGKGNISQRKTSGSGPKKSETESSPSMEMVDIQGTASMQGRETRASTTGLTRTDEQLIADMRTFRESSSQRKVLRSHSETCLAIDGCKQPHAQAESLWNKVFVAIASKRKVTKRLEYLRQHAPHLADQLQQRHQTSKTLPRLTKAEEYGQVHHLNDIKALAEEEYQNKEKETNGNTSLPPLLLRPKPASAKDRLITEMIDELCDKYSRHIGEVVLYIVEKEEKPPVFRRSRVVSAKEDVLSEYMKGRIRDIEDIYASDFMKKLLEKMRQRIEQITADAQ